MKTCLPGEELLRIATSPKEHEANGDGEDDSNYAQITPHVQEENQNDPKQKKDPADDILGDVVRIECWCAVPEVDSQGHIHKTQGHKRSIQAGMGFTDYHPRKYGHDLP